MPAFEEKQQRLIGALNLNHYLPNFNLIFNSIHHKKYYNDKTSIHSKVQL